MDLASRQAFVIAQAACANAEIAAMTAENNIRIERGEAIAYDEEQFMAIQDRYLIGHNAVLEYLRD